MKIGTVISFASATVLVASAAFGQATSKPLEFEVASIKPHAPGENSSSTHLVSGGMNGTNVTLRQLILRAYDFQDFQLLGGPAWVNEARWDVMARSSDIVIPRDPNSLTIQQRRTVEEQMMERLRNLLADRFQLVVRRETREQPIYALVVAKNGPKLQPGKGTNNGVDTNIDNGRVKATFSSASAETLAQQLGRRTGRPVVDKTGLTGNYDFKLEWTAAVGQPGAVDSGLAANASDSVGPTIFTALQEQLGLRLESQKGPVDVITIQHVEKASEN